MHRRRTRGQRAAFQTSRARQSAEDRQRAVGSARDAISGILYTVSNAYQRLNSAVLERDALVAEGRLAEAERFDKMVARIETECDAIEQALPTEIGRARRTIQRLVGVQPHVELERVVRGLP